MPISSCDNPDSHYFDSPDFLQTALHIVTIISTPIYILGIYCILFKTPDQMKSVKLYLFNLHFWIILFDYSVTVLTIPFFLFPELAGIPYGVLRYLGVPTSVQTYTTFVVLTYVAVAIIAIYENRFFILCKFRYKEHWAYGRRIWLIFNYLITPIILAPMFIGHNQEAAKLELFQHLPCLPDHLFQEPVYVVEQNYSMRVGMFIVVFAWAEVGFFITQLIRNINKQVKSKTISEKTYQMHKQFFIALVIQISIPFFLLTLPFLYALENHHFGFYSQAATNFAVIILTTHGFVSTVVMIIVHRPYRLAVKEMIRNGVTPERKLTVFSIR